MPTPSIRGPYLGCFWEPFSDKNRYLEVFLGGILNGFGRLLELMLEVLGCQTVFKTEKAKL